MLPLASRGHEAARRGQGDLLCRLKRVLAGSSAHNFNGPRKQGAKGGVSRCEMTRHVVHVQFWIVNGTGRGWELQSLASEDWVKKYGAGSSELSDARAEDFNLAKRLGFVHLGRLAGFLLGSVRSSILSGMAA